MPRDILLKIARNETYTTLLHNITYTILLSIKYELKIKT